MNQRVALLVDADNASANEIEFAIGEAERRGRITLRRAFGRVGSIAARETVLGRLGFGAEVALPGAAAKNTADFLLSQFAVQLAERRAVDLVVIVSSDSDFATVANGIGASGVPTLCICRQNAPDALKNAASEIVPFQPLPPASTDAAAPAAGKTPHRPVARKVRPSDIVKAVTVIRGSLNDSGGASLSGIGQHLYKAFGGDYKKVFGVSTLTRLIEMLPDDFAVSDRVRDGKASKSVVDLKRRDGT